MEVQKKILVVDDQAAIRYAISRFLKKDWVVEEASTGKQALEMVREAPPDLIFLDLRLTDMDGLDVLRTIRGFNADLPVVILTGRPGEAARRDAYEVGIQGFLRKPFTVSDLKEVIKEALK